jgi:hypothetical protein
LAIANLFSANNRERLAEEIENTQVELVSLPDGQMSHIENQDELTKVLLQFFKKV